MQILERGGETLEAALLEKGAQAELDARAVAQRTMPGAVLAEFLRHPVAVLVFAAEPVDGPVVDGRIRNFGDEIAHAVAVDGKAEPHFGRDLVALGDGDLAHVVAEAGELRALQIVPGPGGAHPGAQPILHLGVLPVADHDLAVEPHARVEEPGLAVAMGGLVEVHEVHVDLTPWQVAVELRVEVNERLAERGKPADPHLRR